jgi:hypothetical protein
MEDARGQAEFEAVFLFSGGGLYVQGPVLGRRFEVVRGGTMVTIILPGSEHVPTELGLPSARAGVEKAAHLASWNPQTGEIHAAVVDTFEVRVGLKPDDQPLEGSVEQAFPLAVEVAERFLAWTRTTAGQYWLPSRQEGVAPAGLYGRLMLAGTDHEVDPKARWSPGHAVMARRPDEAASPHDIDTVVRETQEGSDPATEDVLLADARSAASLLPVSAMWKYERRDTARVVLLAAMAMEVKIKRALRDHARRDLQGLVDVILDNPRDFSIATAQLLDKAMKAAIGVSLREADKPLFRAVTEGLFPLRNQVAHTAYEPTLAEAQEALRTAARLSHWLAHLTGP